jgi:hypothetical protein
MRTSVVLSCVAACSLAALVPLLAMAEPAAETKVIIKDSAISSSIRARLAADDVKRFGHVRIDTDDHAW